MDFGEQSWDVSEEATNLTESLFSSHQKLSGKSKKRKSKGGGQIGVSQKKPKLELNSVQTEIPKVESQSKRKRNRKKRKDRDINIEDERKATQSSKMSMTVDLREKMKQDGKKGKYANNVHKSNNTNEEGNGTNMPQKVKVTNNHIGTANINISADFTNVKESANKIDVGAVDETQALIQKKKRKRKCKKNKFKDYSKESEELSKASEVMQVWQSVSNTGNDSKLSERELANSKKQKTQEKGVKKGKNVNKTEDNIKNNIGDAKKVEIKQEKVQSNTNNRKTGKSKFDPKILSSILSSEKKKLNKEEDTEEKDLSQPVATKAKNDRVSKPKSLLEKNKERLSAARFRYLNEQMYTSTGKAAQQMFQQDEVAFHVYHEGFQSQVEKWPTNPLDLIIDELKEKPSSLVIADFGCGDAKLAQSLPNRVYSFDLVAVNDHVTACDMSKVPLPNYSVHVAVFCLSLMGTNLAAYLSEANRLLKPGGLLKIAEVASRFDSVGSFVLQVESFGFKVLHQDSTNKMFVMMEFRKVSNTDKKKAAQDISLYPCIYKRR